jgi:hypothetical protein
VSGGVIVGFCHPPQVEAGFAVSLVNLSVYDLQHDRLIRGMIPRYSGANVATARNDIVTQFLAKDPDSAEWLLMLDTDMEFPGELLAGLMRHASLERAPIVGALCFGIDGTTVFPTLYGLREDDEGRVSMVRHGRFPANTMWQVAATGAACLLVHRRVFEVVAEQQAGNPFTWFQETVQFGGLPTSEDITFCLRAGLAGFPVHVNTSLPIGHLKRKAVTIADFYARHPDPDRSAAGASQPPLAEEA